MLQRINVNSKFLFKIDTFINNKILLRNILKSKQKAMDPFSLILAPLIVAIITGIGTWVWKDEILRKKLNAAPRKYVEELEKLILRGYDEGLGKAIINARSIVSTRNDLRSSLISISARLNSEIDQLALDIGHRLIKPDEPSVPSTNPNNSDIDAEKAFETIQVLYRNWPAKKVQIEVEIKKLLTELGLDPDSK